MFGITLDMSPEEAIAKVNQLSDEYLHDKWDDLVGEFRKEPSMDDEMDNGMEMLRQQNFNNNNNNNNI